MSTFATNMQIVASRLLQKYGSLVSVVRTSASNFSTADGSITESQIIYQGYGNSDNYNAFEVNNNTVLATDVKFTFSSTTKPLVGDVVTINDTDLRVMRVDTTIAQNTDIVYTLQLRV